MQVNLTRKDVWGYIIFYPTKQKSTLMPERLQQLFDTAEKKLNRKIGSLRSKRFRRAFSRFKAFFAFRTGENWVIVALAPIFAPLKSEKYLERAGKPTETLATQASKVEETSFLI